MVLVLLYFIIRYQCLTVSDCLAFCVTDAFNSM